MTREELIDHIKKNDHKFTYETTSFSHFKYEELFMLKRRIDEENEEEASLRKEQHSGVRLNFQN